MPEDFVHAALFMRIRGPLSVHVPQLMAFDYKDLEAEIVMGQFDVIALAKAPDLGLLGAIVMNVKNQPVRVLEGPVLERRLVHACHDYLVQPLKNPDTNDRRVPAPAPARDSVEAYVILYFGNESRTALDSAVAGTGRRLWVSLEERLKPARLVAAYRILNRARVLVRVEADDAQELHDAIMLAFQNRQRPRAHRQPSGDFGDRDERGGFDRMPIATETLHIVPVPKRLQGHDDCLRRLRMLAKAFGGGDIHKATAASAWGVVPKTADKYLEELEVLHWIESARPRLARISNQRLAWRLSELGCDLVSIPYEPPKRPRLERYGR